MMTRRTICEYNVGDGAERSVEFGVNGGLGAVTRVLNTDGDHGDQKSAKEADESLADIR